MIFAMDNSNGIMENIYYYLWMKDEMELQGEAISIPDTIIYKDSMP